MPKHHFTLNLSAQQVLELYRYPDYRLLVRTQANRRLSIPFRHFRPLVTQAGLSGRFEAVIDGSRLIELRRV
ncbi:DUF2835 family protein [Gallaecimonas sp. GXIMD4217]|uniref:DUF2835 family protein n=1 Tax=Gallaecimonas sp. GXIMD4217 TaxID=3131927 RepID=UPI00311B0ADB